MANKIIIGDPERITKGDTLNIECTLNEDITNWKIRAQMTDQNNNTIKLANSEVTGGSADQIEVTNATNGVFILHFAKGLTNNFCDESSLEVEVENTESPSEKFTIIRGEDTEIKFRDQKIDWDENN